MAFLWDNFFAILCLLVLVTVAIMYIGDRVVTYAERLAVDWKISGGLVGYILVAAVTSIPEVVSTFAASAQGSSALAAGNIFGSNAANIALLAAVIFGLRLSLQRLSDESWSGIAASLLILAVVSVIYLLSVLQNFSPHKILFGMWPLLLYVSLMYLNFTLLKKESAPSEGAGGGLGGFLVYSGLITLCAWLLVILCTRITELPFPGLGRPLGEQFVGTLLLAVATSVPELVTTYSMVRRRLIDMAFGNIFGSNVFNLMIFCLAPLFSSLSTGDFLRSIPLSLMYTTMAIVGFSALISLATFVSNKKIQRIAMAGIVIGWVFSLALVF